MTKAWWKEAVVYQIYPRSFMDSNGDGVGDLAGIASKADYLAELGVSAVWLSPVYASPNADNGYDISDYRAIMKEFGTLDDWKRLLAALHARGIRLVMDLVVNHTSDEHAWFVESRKSREGPYADYYIWREGRGGSCEELPPNDWQSIFSGPAWKYAAERDQWYLHLFAEKQPDLNWENPRVREEVYAMMKYWLDLGVDGFRMDVINMISKDSRFTTFMNGPRIHEFLREMHGRVLAGRDLLTVGETPGVDPQLAALYVGESRNELGMVFQFEHMGVDHGTGGKWDPVPWKLTELKRILGKWQRELDEKGWNSLYLNNHDQPRMVSRFGNDAPRWRETSAKMLATMIHTQQGTPYVYQGEELGMTNVAFPRLEDYDDVEIKNWAREQMALHGKKEADLLPAIHYMGRDNARTPMQWTGGANAGFTAGKPWIGVNPNYREINAEAALADENSVFHYYKRLIALRKKYPILAYGGAFTEFMADSEAVYAYERSYAGSKLLTALNFTDTDQSLAPMAEALKKAGTLLIGNYAKAGSESAAGKETAIPDPPLLRPYEARVYLAE